MSTFNKVLIMKTIVIVILALTLLSCSSSSSGNSIKLDGSNKIIFRDGDVIYFTNIDSSGVSFHYSDDDSVKTKKAKDININDFVIDYESEQTYDFFKPFERQNKDSLQSPRAYISEKYNSFAKILEGEQWGTMTKYRHKKLNVKRLDWSAVADLVSTEVYCRPEDSLHIAIPIPETLETFCREMKTSYPDIKYFILTKNVYLTYNIFEGGTSTGQWIGLPVPGMPSPMFYIEEEELDDAFMITPKVVIDINKGKILSVDVQSYSIKEWEYLTSLIKRIVEEEAEFYNLKF